MVCHGNTSQYQNVQWRENKWAWLCSSVQFEHGRIYGYQVTELCSHLDLLTLLTALLTGWPSVNSIQAFQMSCKQTASKCSNALYCIPLNLTTYGTRLLFTEVQNELCGTLARELASSRHFPLPCLLWLCMCVNLLFVMVARGQQPAEFMSLTLWEVLHAGRWPTARSPPTTLSSSLSVWKTSEQIFGCILI